MSFQAMTWACGKTWGGCSGRAAIYAIANHANDQWFCWAKQSTLAEESEQSPDSVGRRIQEFVTAGLVRRIKLKRHGRRTHDFLILQPSPHFDAPIEVLEQFIPRGCDVMPDADATAPCGSDDSQDQAMASEDSEISAPAPSGSVSEPTLPQPAPDAAALVREQEPLSEPKKDSPLPPEGGIQVEPEGWKEFKAIWEADAIPVSRPSIAMPLVGALSAERRRLLNQAAKGYLHHRSREKKPPTKQSAQTFIREHEAWPGWAKLAPPEPVVLVEWPKGSPEFRALAAFTMLAFREPIRPGTQSIKGSETISAQRLALAQFADDDGHVDRSGWIELDSAEEKNKQAIGAWRNFIKDRCGQWIDFEDVKVIGADGEPVVSITVYNGKELKFPKRRKSLLVPTPWPPRKDGSLGPPQDKSNAA